MITEHCIFDALRASVSTIVMPVLRLASTHAQGIDNDYMPVSDRQTWSLQDLEP